MIYMLVYIAVGILIIVTIYLFYNKKTTEPLDDSAPVLYRYPYTQPEYLNFRQTRMFDTLTYDLKTSAQKPCILI